MKLILAIALGFVLGQLLLDLSGAGVEYLGKLVGRAVNRVVEQRIRERKPGRSAPKESLT